MKIKKLFVFLLGIMGFCFSAGQINFLETEATAITPTYLGRYYETTPLDKETRVYISSSQRSLLTRLGRTYYTETNQGGGIILLSVPVTTKYYYIANQIDEKYVDLNNPISIYNNASSMCTMIKYLEHEAIKFGCSNPTDSVLGYIRSFSTKFASGNYDINSVTSNAGTFVNSNSINDCKKMYWQSIGGPFNSSFINHIDNDVSHGITALNYFSSFLSSNSVLNTSIHTLRDMNETVGSASYLDGHTFYGTELIDNIEEGKTIDLIHLFASMDGVFNDTNSSYSNRLLDYNLEGDMISWSIDLQTILGLLPQKGTGWYSGTFPTMSSIFNEDEFGFSEKTLIASLDALNLTRWLLDESQDTYKIYSSLTTYYFGNFSEDPANRYYSFIENVNSRMPTVTFTSTIDKFNYKVKYMFGLKLVTGSYTEYISNEGNTYGPTTYCFIYKNNNNVYPSVQIRINFSEMFASYIMSKVPNNWLN